ITILPLERPAATPSAPNSTASTCGVSGTMMMTASDCCATSLPDLQATPPPSINSCGNGVMSCRNSLCCPACRWPAPPPPLWPRLERASHRAPQGAEADEPDFHDVSSLGLEDLRRMPAEPVDCCGSRLVFTTHPATIADRIEMTKQERIVDLAGTGLAAAGIV